MIPFSLLYKGIFLKLWLQIFLLFSLYFSSLNLKYLKLTKMELTRFAMKLFKLTNIVHSQTHLQACTEAHYTPTCNSLTHIVSWEPEWRYPYWHVFRWEPEGRYRHRHCTAIVSFWFSTEHLWIMIAPFWLSTDDIINENNIEIVRMAYCR